MDPAIITARLSITQKDGHVFAELVYTNTGDRPALLLKINAALDNKLENDLFKINDERGNEVSYTGVLAKMGKPGPQDFLELMPKEQTSTRVRLDDVYKLATGRPRDYRVVYSAYHQYPDRPGFWELVSNEAHFRP